MDFGGGRLDEVNELQQQTLKDQAKISSLPKR